ncbi:AraC family transcriptional regulator [Paenibacillus pasadenensis]|uniref:AraC family transcriptional regulator n=1 Tax=Paenibacillus pasadenensis TaxID=217090 RepID=UPI00042949A2|nr:AraC family transcriptional regulator [Paenibacillus pasadenensis]
MQPFRKPFQLDPVFPFELVLQGVRRYETELPDHLHDLYELVYVHDGQGTFFIDGSLYEKKAGDLFLIPGNTVHRAFPSSGDPIVSTALFFAPSLVHAESLDDGHHPLRCFERARKSKQHKAELTQPARLAVEAAIEAIAGELQTAAAGYRHAVKLHLQQLLLALSRLPMHEEAPRSDLLPGPKWVHDALRTIDRDPIRCGGLKELASAACVSAPHFSRVFKQMTGMNVTDYVGAKRLVAAKERLLATDDNVEAIANDCGFLGLPHFYQAFKKLTGMTPRGYRLQSRLEPKE